MRGLDRQQRHRGPNKTSTIRRAWTETEDAYLHEVYGAQTQKEMGVALDRSWQAIAQRVVHLGLAVGRYGNGWSETDLRILEDLAGTMSWREIADYLGKSWGSVQTKAWKSGFGGRRTRTPEQQALIEEVRGTYTYNYGPEWPERRLEALERDGWRCQEPDCDVFSPSGGGLQVHHIVRRKLIQSDDLRWLVTLCVSHHMAQDAHWWPDFTPEMLERLPDYQRLIYEGVAA
jgi:hypothetical protein